MDGRKKEKMTGWGQQKIHGAVVKEGAIQRRCQSLDVGVVKRVDYQLSTPPMCDSKSL
jgi:hypothetical protein